MTEQPDASNAASGATDIRMVKLIEVLQVTAMIGEGVAGDPCRVVDQYWTLDGEFIAEVQR